MFQGSECFASYSTQGVHETFFSKTVSVQSTAENAEIADSIEDEQINYAKYPLSLYFSASSAPSAVNYYQKSKLLPKLFLKESFLFVE